MNYYQNIIQDITERLKRVLDRREEAELEIFKRLIILLGEEYFNKEFEYYFLTLDGDFDHKFYSFHKYFRQVDPYCKEPFNELGVHIDVIAWYFFHLTDLPYYILKKVFENSQGP